MKTPLAECIIRSSIVTKVLPLDLFHVKNHFLFDLHDVTETILAMSL